MGTVTPLLTSRKILNITYQTPQETLLGTPETLPTTEPATPQIGCTVASADLPTFSITPYSKVFIAAMYGAGKFVTAGTVYWRTKKNSVSVATGSLAVTANTFYTVNAFFYDIAVGDVLEIALWSTVTDSNWDYKAYQIQVSRVVPIRQRNLKDPTIQTFSQEPTLTLGNPHAAASYGVNVWSSDKTHGTFSAGSATFNLLYAGVTYGTFTDNFGDDRYKNGADVRISGTYRPYYESSRLPHGIVCRGVRFD